tara:strand:+ start:437 stop:1627 length:1191 start_codon:yes stop_codon:yes gene_type:complete
MQQQQNILNPKSKRKFLMQSINLVVACAIGACATIADAQTQPRDTWRHSCYAFKDMNRNGIFDMGDKPYANLPVEMTRPDGTKTRQRSNIDGFANFEASLGDDSADVFEPGHHNVRAIFDEGWQSLSKTATQNLIFIEKVNAGGRIVPEKPCMPIGVVPILEIKGKITPVSNFATTAYSVVAIDKRDQTRLDLLVDENGNFLGIGRQGEWRLEVRNPDGVLVHARDFVIEHGAVYFSNIVPGETTKPEADVVWHELTFDDFLVSDSLFEIPSGYGGLNSYNLIAVHNRFYEGGGYVNGTVSSEYIAYNSSGVPVPIWADDPFDFKGTYVSVAWSRGKEEDVIFRAWREGKIVHEDKLRLTNSGPIYFDANYENITKMEISHGNYERIVLDNFHYKF